MTREEADAINKAEFEAESREILKRALAYAAQKRANEREKLAKLDIDAPVLSTTTSGPSSVPVRSNNTLRAFRPGRLAKRHEAFGQSKTITQWSQETGVKEWRIRDRLKHGASLEQALTHRETYCWKAKVHEAHGSSHTLREWSAISGISVAALEGRIKRGSTMEEALSRPLGRSKGRGRGRVEAPAPEPKTGGVPSTQETQELEVFN